jgi:hypothetical protein
MTWLTAKSLFGAPRWLLGLGIILALASAGAIIAGNIDTTVKTISTTAREAGKAEAVSAGQATTLDQIGKSNDAATKIRDNRGLARFCQCVRSATEDTARNCIRYLPNEPVPAQPIDTDRSCPG